MDVRPFDPAIDLEWAEALLDHELGGRLQARRGQLIDVLGGGGLVAAVGGERVGLLCWHLGPDRTAEIAALAVDREFRRRGIGRALLDAAAGALREMGVDRVWLVTTNENLEALALYQKAGFRLTALHPGAVDDLRRRLKPSIPLVSPDGIAVHDELELQLDM